MRHRLCVLPLILCILSFSHLAGQTTFPEEGIRHTKPVYTLIQGATVHQAGAEPTVADVLVYEDKIKAVGANAISTAPANTRLVDGKEKHLYPSFIDLRSTYGVPLPQKKEHEHDKAPQDGRSSNTSTYWNDAIKPQVDAIAHFEPEAKAARKLRDAGIGLALVHMPDGVARGTSALVLTGEGEANKLTLRSRAAAHFSFEKGSSPQDYPSSLMGCVALLRQALYDAQWYAKADKPETNYSLEALNAQRDMPLFFEGRDRYDIQRLGRMGEEFDLDFTVCEPGYAYMHLGRMSPRIKALVIPLKLPKPFDTSDPDLLRFIDQGDMLHWEQAPYNALRLSKENMPFAFTTLGLDSADAVWKTLRKLHSLGLSEDAILSAFTTTPATVLGVQGEVGRLAEGYEANFFMANGDLLLDSDVEITAHYLRGKTYAARDQATVQLKGTYDLNINNVYLELMVEGKHPKYEAQAMRITGNDTLKSKASLKLLGRELSLAFLDFDSSGYYRLSASSLSQNRIWDGTGITPRGEQVRWSAIRKVPKVKNGSANGKADPKNNGKAPSAAKALDHGTMGPPPPLRYPMAAYGFDTLPKPETLHITNAKVWTNTSQGIISKGEVLIHEGKVLAVGKDLNPQEYFRKGNMPVVKVLDARGMHLTPGIIDEHSHIAISRGVNEGTQAVTSEVRIADALNPDDINIFRQLAGGVTTSQLLHGSANPIGGQSAIVKLRWGQPYGKMLMQEAPPFIKFALGENVKQTNWGDHQTTRYPQTRMGVEQIFYDYFHRARQYGDLLTLHQSNAENKGKRKPRNAQEAPAFRRDLELEALLEILNGERHITCHSYVQSEINMLMHVADSMRFKVNTFTHILEGYKIADKLAAHGAAASSFSDWWAYKYEVRDAIPHNGSILHRAGVLTSFNSDDAEMARRLNQEASKAIRYGGMSEEDALKLVTLNPAKMMHIDHVVGSIAPGMHADLVVWSDNPLSVYARAEITFVDGCRYFDRSTLPEMMQRDQAIRTRIANAMAADKEDAASLRKPERKMERYYHCTDIEEQ